MAEEGIKPGTPPADPRPAPSPPGDLDIRSSSANPLYWIAGIIAVAAIAMIAVLISGTSETRPIEADKKDGVAQVEVRVELELDRLEWQNKEMAKRGDWVAMLAASKKNLEQIRVLIETLPEAKQARWFDEVEKRFQVKFQRK